MDWQHWFWSRQSKPVFLKSKLLESNVYFIIKIKNLFFYVTLNKVYVIKVKTITNKNLETKSRIHCHIIYF